MKYKFKKIITNTTIIALCFSNAFYLPSVFASNNEETLRIKENIEVSKNIEIRDICRKIYRNNRN